MNASIISIYEPLGTQQARDVKGFNFVLMTMYWFTF